MCAHMWIECQGFTPQIAKADNFGLQWQRPQTESIISSGRN